MKEQFRIRAKAFAIKILIHRIRLLDAGVSKAYLIKSDCVYLLDTLNQINSNVSLANFIMSNFSKIHQAIPRNHLSNRDRLACLYLEAKDILQKTAFNPLHKTPKNQINTRTFSLTG